MTGLSNFRIFLPGTFLWLLISFSSCQNDQAERSKEKMAQEQAATFAKKMQFPTFHKITLLPKAKEEITTWPDFSTVKIEVESMQGFTIHDMVQNAKNMAESMQNMQKTVPEKLQTKPVMARIVVLESLARMLEQLTANPFATADEIENLAVKIPPAFENLKIQINEAFREELEDFQTEIDTKPKPVVAPVMQKPPGFQKTKQ